MSLEKKIIFEELKRGKNEIVENFWKLSKICYANFGFLLAGAYRAGDNVKIYDDDDEIIIITKHIRINSEVGIEYINKLNLDIDCGNNTRLELLTDEHLAGMIQDVEELLFAAEQPVKSIYDIVIKK